jgi:hypothetical protein
MPPRLKSNLCRQDQLESQALRRWCPPLHEPFKLPRKLWEYCYIAQALDERGFLKPGTRGLGFGVGKEPLTALFAQRGCRIVATDLDIERAQAAGWVQTNQHAEALGALNDRGICPADDFRARVEFRNVDMNEIPADLQGFDFTWSSCCFEHLGSIANGLRFIERQMECLRPGGVAVHTTEFNVSSNEETIDDNGFIVLFRRRDIEELARRLEARGHRIKLDLTPGRRIADGYVDLPPYDKGPYHLKLQWDRFVTTSIGLIITRGRTWTLRRIVRGVWRRLGRG